MDRPTRSDDDAQTPLDAEWAFPGELLVLESKILGIGSLGEVHAAILRGTPVAAKTLHWAKPGGAGSGLQPDERRAVVRQMLKECELLRRIRHPNVVAFMGVGIDGDRRPLWLVTERLERTLHAALHGDGAHLAVAHEKPVLVGVGRALTYLHEQHCIHRDVKSSNVLLDAHGVAKLCDLGEGFALSQHRRSHTAGVGTPNYMAPEMKAGDTEKGVAVDVFSFGVVIGEVSSRMVPTPGPEVQRGPTGGFVLVASRERYAQLLSAMQSPELREVATTCLADEPENRPAAATVLARLEALPEAAAAGGGGVVGSEAYVMLVNVAVREAEARMQQQIDALREEVQRERTLRAETDALREEIASVREEAERQRQEAERKQEEAERVREETEARTRAELMAMAASREEMERRVSSLEQLLSSGGRAVATAGAAVVGTAPAAAAVLVGVTAGGPAATPSAAIQAGVLPSVAVVSAVAPAALPALRGAQRSAPVLIVREGQFTNGHLCCVYGDEILVGDDSHRAAAVFADSGALRRRLGEGELVKPRGCAVASGAAYVADYCAHCFVAYPVAGGRRIRSVGLYGGGRGQLSHPYGIAVDGTRVYVADSWNKRVCVFSEDGTFIACAGKDGGAPGELSYLNGICVDAQQVFVAESTNERVSVFRASDLSFARHVGVDAGLSRPQGVCAGRGLLIVGDASGKRVVVFDVADGRVVASLPGFGDADEEVFGVALRARDAVLFVTTSKWRVYKVELA